MKTVESRRRPEQFPSAWRLLASANVSLRWAALLLCLSASNCVRQGNIGIDKLEYRNEQASYPSIPDDRESLLQRSKCFWMGAEEAVRLSWEAVATVREGNDPSTAFRIGACNNENADNGDLLINGHRVETPPWRTFVPANLMDCTDTYFDDNAYGDCRVRTHCTPDASPCGNAFHPNFPYCADNCSETPATDITYQLLVSNPRPTAGATMTGPSPAPLVISPTFYPVRNSRTLSRKMVYSAPDSGSTRKAFTWNVPSLADQRWEDNFSPNLFLSKVRAFIPVPNSNLGNQRQYLNLSEVAIGNSLISRIQHCDPDPDDSTQVTASKCPTLQGALPTYSYVSGNTVNVKAIWTVRMPAANAANITIDENSKVYVEFTLADRSGGGAGPQLAPRAFDFAQVYPTGRPQAPTAFSVTNDVASRRWTIDSVSVDGPNGSEFSAQVHGSRMAPFDLGRLDAFSIDVSASPTSQGQKSATLRVQMHSGGETQNLSGDLRASAVGPALLNVQPLRLYFDSSFGTRPLPWRKALLISNNGPTPMPRCLVTVSGTDQFAFRLHTDAPSPSTPLACPNVNARPGPGMLAPVMLQPGQAEIVNVDFCPRRRGTFAAELTVIANTSGGIPANWATATVALHGDGPPNSVAVCTQ